MLSFDTFLKTIGAEMNAPGRSNRRPYFFLVLDDLFFIQISAYIGYVLIGI